METESYDAPNLSAELLPGTLSMLILKTLVRGAIHGAAIAQSIHRASGGALRVQEGALYPALHRLELRNWVVAEPGLSLHKRRANFYRLTPEGVKALSGEHARWTRMTAAIRRVMENQD